MEPVEINAGAWYLRALRAEDRSALAELGETDVGYTTHRAAQWESDAAYSWAVCEPTTGELLAEIVLDPVTAVVRSRARPGHGDAAAAAEASVRRFAGSALGIDVKT
jgi:hypothetical protein